MAKKNINSAVDPAAYALSVFVSAVSDDFNKLPAYKKQFLKGYIIASKSKSKRISENQQRKQIEGTVNMNAFPQRASIESCSICGWKTVVVSILNGSNHTIKTIVTCWDCMTPEQKAATEKQYSLKVEDDTTTDS